MSELPAGETRLYPILGDPIKFVKSPQRLTAGFRARGRNAMCIPLQVPEGCLDAVMGGLDRTPNVDGLLITMPHKTAAFPYCATATARTKALGIVSVMRRNADGSWHGENTDGGSFVKAQRDQGARHDGARVLLVGAGGAGSAIAVALLEAGVGELIVHDVDSARAARLVELVSGPTALRLGNRRARVGPPDPAGCDIVCNATPMGMGAGDPPPVALERLTDTMFVADVIAGHGETPLMLAARRLGCSTADGVHMVEAVQEIMLDFLLRE